MKTSADLGTCLLLLLFSAACSPGSARGQTTNGYDFESLLGKSLTSPEVQDFIKSNQLINEPTSSPGGSICQNTNSKSPFILILHSNHIYMVSLTLVPTRMDPYAFPAYTWRLPHGLRTGETVESVIHRLGQPTRLDASRALPYLCYEKLHLQLDFDPKKGSEICYLEAHLVTNQTDLFCPRE